MDNNKSKKKTMKKSKKKSVSKGKNKNEKPITQIWLENEPKIIAREYK